MKISARLTIPELTSLMAKMPEYREYLSALEAAEAERTFRHALGAPLFLEIGFPFLFELLVVKYLRQYRSGICRIRSVGTHSR